MISPLPYRTIILANGEMPSHPFALEMLRNANTIVCCDGAVRHLEKLQLQPTAIVGDGDSIPAEIRKRYADRISPDKCQEYNDLTKAFHYVAAHHPGPVAVLGAMGLREDHAFANLALLMRHARSTDTIMVTNYGVFSPIFHSTTFASHEGEAVSIFSFTPSTRLTFSGLRYPVKNRSFAELWEGTLNEALSNQFRIELRDEGEVLVYQAFQKENL